MTYSLTPRQAECLAIIREAINTTGMAPTLSELADKLGLSSSSKGAVHNMLTALEERGHIMRLHQRARAIRILDGDKPDHPAIMELPPDSLPSGG